MRLKEGMGVSQGAHTRSAAPPRGLRLGQGPLRGRTSPAPEPPGLPPQCLSGGKQEYDCQLSGQQSAVGRRGKSASEGGGLWGGCSAASLPLRNILSLEAPPGRRGPQASPDPVGNLWVQGTHALDTSATQTASWMMWEGEEDRGVLPSWAPTRSPVF